MSSPVDRGYDPPKRKCGIPQDMSTCLPALEAGTPSTPFGKLGGVGPIRKVDAGRS